MKRPVIHNAEEARNYAIQWQNNIQNKPMSWEDCYKWSEYFQELAYLYDLEEEFLENGII